MSEREKARAALKKLDELDEKRREQERLYRQLRNRLLDEAYEHRRGTHSGISHRDCSNCRRPFEYGDQVEELLGDAGETMLARHYPSCEDPWNTSRDVMTRRRGGAP